MTEAITGSSQSGQSNFDFMPPNLLEPQILPLTAEQLLLVALLRSNQALMDQNVAFTAENQRLAELATHDPLTELLNRRGFMEETERVLAHAQRANELTSFAHLAYLDVDLFKDINDTYGHPAGDRVLRELGKLLKHHLRMADVIGRLGGDEFGVILVNCSKDTAKIAMERLRLELDQADPVEYEGNKIKIPNFSIGLIPIQPLSTTGGIHAVVEELLSQADTAMYEQKRKRQKERGSSIV